MTSSVSSPTKNRLLICGASVRAAAWSAKTAGFDVVAMDLFGDADLWNLATVYTVPTTDYPDKLVSVAREIVVNESIGAWLYTGAFENHPSVIQGISVMLPLLGNDIHSIRAVRDPARLTNWFAEARIPFPALANCRQDLVSNKRWLVKPRASAAGHGIKFWDSSMEVTYAHTPKTETDACDGRTGRASDDPSHVYQQFIEGPTYAGVFLADAGRSRLLGVTRLWTNRDLQNDSRRNNSYSSNDVSRVNDFHYIGSTGPIGLTERETMQWNRIGDVVARCAGLRGLFGVDAVLAQSEDAATVYPIEVNPRYTASVEVLERAFGHSFMPHHTNACRTLDASGHSLAKFLKPITPLPRIQSAYWGKRILFAERETVYDEAMRSRLSTPPRAAIEWHLADTPAIGTTIPAHAPILTTIASSQSLPGVEQALGFCKHGK